MMRVTYLAALAPAALLLTACEQEERTYEVDAVDQSGGELQVADPAAAGVEVDLPQTEMTNAPAIVEGEEIAGDAAPPPAE